MSKASAAEETQAEPELRVPAVKSKTAVEVTAELETALMAELLAAKD